MVNAGEEVDFRGREGVGWGQLDLQAEFTVCIGGGRRASQDDMPEGQVGLVGNADTDAGNGRLLEILILLKGEEGIS